MDAISGSAARSIPSGTYKLGDLMSTSVLRMQQDKDRADGAAAQSLIEAAGRIQAREPGKGERVDVTG